MSASGSTNSSASGSTSGRGGFGGAPRYRDAWPLVHGHHPHAPTFCLHSDAYSKTPYCCDFVFVSDDLAPRVRSIEVDLETQASDHQPVIMELDDR